MDFSNVSNKLYDERDVDRKGPKPGPVWDFYNAYTQCLEIQKDLTSKGNKPGGAQCQYWEYGNLIESTQPSSGDRVCVVEGYHQPHSILPFYLNELGCDVTIVHNIHEFWYPWIKKDEYINAGINRIERTDWYNIPDFCSNLDAIYCTRELEHTNTSGTRYLSVNNYEEVVSRAKSTLDLWLSASSSVSCTHNLFGTNCSLEDLVDTNGWGDAPNDYYHPFSSSRLTELLSHYSVDVNYEDFSDNKYGDSVKNWSDYYEYNTPRESTINFPVEICYTIASFTITR